MIAIPHHQRVIISLFCVVKTKVFLHNPYQLVCALGQNIDGTSLIINLVHCCSVMFYGCSGTGKSMALHTIVISLLLRLKADHCRLILIEEQQNELMIYNGIPHLIRPVIRDDPKQTLNILQTISREIEERHRKMTMAGVSSFEDFNRLAQRTETQGEFWITINTGYDPDTGKPLVERQLLDVTVLPYIVIVIDALERLIKEEESEIEDMIKQLVVKAHRVGIHLIVAVDTQFDKHRTHALKECFQTHISFQVPARVYSRMFLDDQGAEQLMNWGDFLYRIGQNHLLRGHSAYISKEDIESVVRFFKTSSLFGMSEV